jgi:hypothetical protein
MLSRYDLDELIRRLKARGWSLRAIADHPRVGISHEMVRRVLASGPVIEVTDDGDVVVTRRHRFDPKADQLPPEGSPPGFPAHAKPAKTGRLRDGIDGRCSRRTRWAGA